MEEHRGEDGNVFAGGFLPQLTSETILGAMVPANDLYAQQPRSCWPNSNHGPGVRDALPPHQRRDFARNRGFSFEITDTG